MSTSTDKIAKELNEMLASVREVNKSYQTQVEQNRTLYEHEQKRVASLRQNVTEIQQKVKEARDSISRQLGLLRATAEKKPKAIESSPDAPGASAPPEGEAPIAPEAPEAPDAPPAPEAPEPPSAATPAKPFRRTTPMRTAVSPAKSSAPVDAKASMADEMKRRLDARRVGVAGSAEAETKVSAPSTGINYGEALKRELATFATLTIETEHDIHLKGRAEPAQLAELISQSQRSGKSERAVYEDVQKANAILGALTVQLKLKSSLDQFETDQIRLNVESKALADRKAIADKVLTQLEGDLKKVTEATADVEKRKQALLDKEKELKEAKASLDVPSGTGGIASEIPEAPPEAPPAPAAPEAPEAPDAPEAPPAPEFTEAAPVFKKNQGKGSIVEGERKTLTESEKTKEQTPAAPSAPPARAAFDPTKSPVVIKGLIKKVVEGRKILQEVNEPDVTQTLERFDKFPGDITQLSPEDLGNVKFLAGRLDKIREEEKTAKEARLPNIAKVASFLASPSQSSEQKRIVDDLLQNLSSLNRPGKAAPYSSLTDKFNDVFLDKLQAERGEESKKRKEAQEVLDRSEQSVKENEVHSAGPTDWDEQEPEKPRAPINIKVSPLSRFATKSAGPEKDTSEMALLRNFLKERGNKDWQRLKTADDLKKVVKGYVNTADDRINKLNAREAEIRGVLKDLQGGHLPKGKLPESAFELLSNDALGKIAKRVDAYNLDLKNQKEQAERNKATLFNIIKNPADYRDPRFAAMNAKVKAALGDSPEKLTKSSFDQLYSQLHPGQIREILNLHQTAVNDLKGVIAAQAKQKEDIQTKQFDEGLVSGQSSAELEALRNLEDLRNAALNNLTAGAAEVSPAAPEEITTPKISIGPETEISSIPAHVPATPEVIAEAVPTPEPPSPISAASASVSAASSSASATATATSSHAEAAAPEPTVTTPPSPSHKSQSVSLSSHLFDAEAEYSAEYAHQHRPDIERKNKEDHPEIIHKQPAPKIEVETIEQRELRNLLVELRQKNEVYRNSYEQDKDPKKQVQRTGFLFLANTVAKYENSKNLHKEINAKLISAAQTPLTTKEVKELLDKYKELDKQAMGLFSRTGQVDKMLKETEEKLTKVEGYSHKEKPHLK